MGRRWVAVALVVAGGASLTVATVGAPAMAADVVLSCQERGFGAPVQFIGEAVSRQADTVTFAVSAVKVGAIDGRMATVDFGNDSRHLHLGQQYDVSARTSPRIVSQTGLGGPDAAPRLQAKVSAGGDGCFAATRFGNGSAIDTGLLSPLLGEWRQVVLAIATPVVAMLLLLGLLVMLKRLVLRIRWGRYA